jgi:PAS domain S-box-containing protein
MSQALLDNSLDPVVMISRSKREIVAANDPMAELTGHAREALAGKPLAVLQHDTFRLEAILTPGVYAQATVRRSDGYPQQVQVTVVDADQGGDLCLAIVQDEGARRRLEREVVTKDRELRAMKRNVEALTQVLTDKGTQLAGSEKELRKAHERADAAEQLAFAGRLAMSIFAELRGPAIDFGMQLDQLEEVTAGVEATAQDAPNASASVVADLVRLTRASQESLERLIAVLGKTQAFQRTWAGTAASSQAESNPPNVELQRRTSKIW